MKIMLFNNVEQLYDCAYDMVSNVVNGGSATLGLATGSTPLPLYERMVKFFNQGKDSYKNVTTFNLDEYVGLSGDNENSYRYFMNNNLFNKIDIDLARTAVPQGQGDLAEQCNRYDEMLADSTIDLQLLGIGNNGHIAFNEPYTSHDSTTHIVDLTESTVKANSRLFDDESQVPRQAITMGLASIMQSKSILVIAVGSNKAQAVFDMASRVDESCPASILLNHPNVTVMCDSEAGELVKNFTQVQVVA